MALIHILLISVHCQLARKVLTDRMGAIALHAVYEFTPHTDATLEENILQSPDKDPYKKIAESTNFQQHQHRLTDEQSAEQWVAATSDRFLRRFVNSWLFIAFALWMFLLVRMPTIQYPSYIMLAAGVPARFAIHRGWMRLARRLFIIPLCVGVIAVPLLVNGVRTPVIANMPMLVLMAGWMLGRRAMAVLSALFVASVILFFLAETNGWITLNSPLRTPEVWAMVWVSVTCVTGIVAWSLVGNYETNYFQQRESQRRLATALEGAEAANRELAESLDFNETVILNSPLPIGVYAGNGQCVLVNDAYATLVGATRDALLSQNLHHIGSWQTSGLLDDCLSALHTGKPQAREIHIQSTFNKDVWVDCRIIPTHLKGEHHLLIQFFDLTARKRMEETLRNFAFHDSLTMLPNRRLLLDRLGQALRASKRLNNYVGVLFIDLDKFKTLNDTHGHDVGDQLLIEVAKRLRLVVRETDTVARLGGDEFVVLLMGLGDNHGKAATHATLITDKIHRALNAEYQLGELRYHGSASVGVKLFLGEGGDADQVLKEADMDMYEAKKSKTRKPRLVS